MLDIKKNFLFSKKYRLFDIFLISILFVGLFTAHIDIVRFLNVFKGIYFDSNVTYFNWDLPWYLAQKYPLHDFPYSPLMLFITSFPLYLYQLFFNQPSELFLIILAKIPIILTFIIFYSFQKLMEVRKINLLLLIVSPQIILQQVFGGQYDIIVYVILYIGLIRTLDNIKDSRTLFIRFVILVSFIGYIKLSVLLVSLPVCIFLFLNYLYSTDNRKKLFGNQTIKILSIFGVCYTLPVLSDLILRYNSIYYYSEVGNALVLIGNNRFSAFIIFSFLYILLLFISIYAGIRVNRSHDINNLKDILLIILIMTGLCFSNPNYSYGWASIVSISFVGLSPLSTRNLKIYFLIYLLAFLLAFCVIPNSPFFDILGPIKNFIENKEGLYGAGIGYIYRLISLFSESFALSISRFFGILYLISSLMFYQKSFRRIIRLIN